LTPSIQLKPMQVGHVDYDSNYKSIQMLSHPISSGLKLSANALEYSYIIWIVINMPNLHGSKPYAWN
jgi:hypothetical protein